MTAGAVVLETPVLQQSSYDNTWVETPGIMLLNAENNSMDGINTYTTDGNSITISENNHLHGSYTYRHLFGGTTNECYAYVSFTPGNDIYARAYVFYSEAFASFNTAHFVPLRIEDSTYGWLTILMLEVDVNGNINSFRFYYSTNNEYTWVDIPGAFTVTKGVPHYIEMRYLSHATNGAAELWFDGTLIQSVTGIATSNHQGGSVRFGQAESGYPTNGSYIDIDDIKISNTYIGAYNATVHSDSIVCGTPVLGSPVLIRWVSLTANNLTGTSPVLGTPVLSEINESLQKAETNGDKLTIFPASSTSGVLVIGCPAVVYTFNLATLEETRQGVWTYNGRLEWSSI